MARAVCGLFGFVDARGGLREASCLAALRELEEAGGIRLPPPGRGFGISRKPRVLDEAVAPAAGVPACVHEVGGLHIRLIEGDAERRILSTLLRDEHPQGAVQHGGRQLRYLIGSDHGWLGGFVFASPCSALGARDRWIGWTAEERRDGLRHVIGMSRFLLRGHVRCRNLASKALGLCRRRLGADFLARYGIELYLVETFAGPEHSGASLGCAGWTYVGESTGRGRRGSNARPLSKKAVWMRGLRRDWRRRLGVRDRGLPPPRRPSRQLAPGDGLDMDQWAENEFGAVPLGRALVKRLVKSVRIQSMAPSKTFFSAAGGNQAAVTGYYRMIERPEEDGFTPEAILSAHRERTLQRMRAQRDVLLIEDGTDLNFATHHGCSGLGVLSGGNGKAKTLGMHLHSTLAVSAAGIPLGVPRLEFDCPDGVRDANKPPEARKSARWLRGWRDSSDLARACPATRVISMMDREGDIAALFCARQAEGGAELLVRAQHDRVLGDDETLFATLRSAPAQGAHEVQVDRASARRGARGQKSFAGREARRAATELRWRQVELPVPRKQRKRLGTEPIRLNAVHVLEPSPPNGAEGIEWLLLTTLPVRSQAEAETVLGFYALRWRIEDWHRILKSGCDVEKIAHSRAERIQRAVTLNAVIAWRLAALTLMGRHTPELAAEKMFSHSELAMLMDYAGELGLGLESQQQAAGLPDLAAVSLGEALLLVARLGGYLNRKHDAPPGHQVVWEGYMRMATGAQTMERIVKRGDESALHALYVRRNND